MEIMYANETNKYFKKGNITGFYKDKIDIIDYYSDFYGITYDDEWTVKRFLNGLKLKINNSIYDYLKSFELDLDILNKKIKILSTNEFKYVLLIYLLLMEPEVYIFDYFDIGLSYKNRKTFINVLRKLKSQKKTIIVITNDLGFMYEVADYVMIVVDKKLIYNGLKNEIFEARRIDDYPPIIDFIRKANNKGANLQYTMDVKELIKDIYRSLR